MAPDPNNLLGGSDLSGFIQAVTQANPYGMIGNAISSWQPNTSTWSPTETGVASFAKAFLSGLANNYAKQDTANQVMQVAGALPTLTADPLNAVTPEGVNPEAFALLRASSYLKKNAMEEATKQNLLEKGIDISDPSMANLSIAERINRIMQGQKKAEAQGNIEGQMAAYGTSDSSKVPGTPQYEANKEARASLDKLRNEFNALPEVKTFSIAQKAAEAMAGALKDPGAASDLELTRYSIQMIEPGMAVREGEQAAVLGSGSIPEQWKGQINKTLSSGSALTPEVREGLKRLASRAYSSQKNAYDKALTYHQGLAVGRGLDPNMSISYLGEAPAVESIFGRLNLPDVNTFAAQAKARGLSKEQAKAEWLALQGGQ